ncbi:MAG: TolC family protein [Limisphaerales bacterium]
MLPKRLPTVLAALCGCFLLHPGPANAQQTVPPPQQPWDLTIENALQMALTNNLDVRINILYPEMDQYALNGLYGAYEPTGTGSATHQFNAFPSGFFSQAGLRYPATVDQINAYQPGINGLTPSGATYSLTGPLSEQNVKGSQDLYNSGPTISLTQPLLKNMWINSARYQILLGKNTIKNDLQGVRLQVMNVVFNVKSAYYNLISARQNVTVEQAAVALAEETYHEDEQKVQVGALAPLDEKQAESQAASARSDLLTTQANLVVQENVMKALLAVPMGQWAGKRPVPTETLVAVPSHPQLLECWRTGLEKRPDMLQAKLGIERQHITLKYDFNQLFPEIDLVGSYGRNATELTLGNNLNAISHGDYYAYTYGISMTIPLGFTGARNNYRSAKAGLQQLLLQAKKVEQTVVAAIDNDVKTVESDLQKVDSTRQARLYAEDALEAEQLKLHHGRSTSFIVLQLQNNLTTARLAEIQALAGYNIALEQLALDEGINLEQNRIDLQVRHTDLQIR